MFNTTTSGLGTITSLLDICIPTGVSFCACTPTVCCNLVVRVMLLKYVTSLLKTLLWLPITYRVKAQVHRMMSRHLKKRIFNLSTVDILGQIIFVSGAILCTVGYSLAFLASPSCHFSSVTQSCPTLCHGLHTPWTAAHQASLSITNSQSLLKLVSITMESVMPSNHLIICRPLLLPPSILPSIRIFSSESALPIRWPKYWSFSISPSRIDFL